MKIIDGNLNPYFIDVETSQFLLKETCTVQSGDNIGSTYEMTLGYYTNFENCLNHIVHLKLAKTESVVDLKTFISQYRKYTEEFKQVYNDYLPKFNSVKNLQGSGGSESELSKESSE